MNEANLTRFGPQRLDIKQPEPTTVSSTFKAINAPAELRLQHEHVEQVQISLNGSDVALPDDWRQHREIRIPLTLGKDNTLNLGISGALGGSAVARITQLTKANLGLLRQGYFGLNTTNIERQRRFYELLGFIGEIYPAGPERSTTFAQSLGFEDNYLIHVSLHSLENPPTPPFVDTVQFREDSYREEPPYAALNHLGMAYATYSTSDLDGDYSYLKSKGVEFVSAPTTAPNGERFVFLKEQDGAYLKLIATTDGGASNTHPNLVRLANTNMNVSDLERSREFYRLLGFNDAEDTSQAGSGDFAAAHGFSGPIEFQGKDVSFGAGAERATLQLRQWQTPYDDEAPYPPPVNHLGIDRINFYVEDLTATVAIMNDLGFEQLGPIGGSPEIGIVFFFDPDGIKVQFAGPQPLP